MKKLIYLSFIAFLMSCTYNNENSNQTPISSKVVKEIKLKTFAETAINGISESSTVNFEYLNNQISKIETNFIETNNVEVKEFVYNGNKIIKIKNYVNNEYRNDDVFTYNNDILTNQSHELNGNSWQINKFNYNYGKLNWVEVNDNPIPAFGTYLTYSDNNVSEIKHNYAYFYSKSQFSNFDTKYNPFRNANQNFKTIFCSWRIFNDEQMRVSLNENNHLTENIYTYDNAFERTIQYSITYDADNFPIFMQGKDVATNAIVVTIEYSYINL